jgi:DNA (cytosine-5)-methyltransferase 1
LIIGGPPCQAYSIAGRVRDENGMHDDYRNFLFEGYLKVVKHFRPALFVFENVEGILTAKPGGISIIDRIREGFSAIGYEIVSDIRTYAVIECSEFGVPQNRKRVIIIGLSKDAFPRDRDQILRKFYSQLLSNYRIFPKKTVRDAIGRLPKFKPLSKPTKSEGKNFSHEPFACNISHHVPRFHNKRDIEIFRDLALDIAKGNGGLNNIEAIKELYTKKTGKVSNVHKYYVLRWAEQSNAIVAHLYKDGLRHIHPDFTQARSITVREAARLQTFDDDFDFIGGMGEQFKMIGNAVPPAFANKLAVAISSHLIPKRILSDVPSGILTKT